MPRAAPAKRAKLKAKPKKPLLSHHRHSFRLLPHTHTSHPVLLMVLLMLGVLLFYTVNPVHAADVQVRGVNLGGPLPSGPAIIVSPADGANFTASPVPVTGTCPANQIVKLYRNDLFSGSTLCTMDGTWTIITELFPGWNILKARVFNHADREGPQGNTVNVFYDTTLTEPFYITTEVFYRAAFFGQTTEWEFMIVGGAPPFEVSVTWGDGYSTIIPTNDRIVKVRHSYTSGPSGRVYYPIAVSATDKHKRRTSLQVFTVISTTDAPGTTTKLYLFDDLYDNGWLRKMILSWSAYGILLLMVISFWLGDRYGIKTYLQKQNKLRRQQRRRNRIRYS